MTYEARHKELRDALAATPASVKFPSTAFQNVLDFEHRTGPLVREVVSVSRELARLMCGPHDEREVQEFASMLSGHVRRLDKEAAR